MLGASYGGEQAQWAVSQSDNVSPPRYLRRCLYDLRWALTAYVLLRNNPSLYSPWGLSINSTWGWGVEWRGVCDLGREKYCIFICTNPRLEWNTSFHYKCRQQTTVTAVPATLTKRTHTYFSYHFIPVTGISKYYPHLPLPQNHRRH